ncbi:MAG: hypothetical protein NWQ13_05850, partial [Glaciimonas sp.]|nr:hypothetical protein [Glaciimonas sp.]
MQSREKIRENVSERVSAKVSMEVSERANKGINEAEKTPALVVQGLHACHQKTPILHDINLSIAAGQVTVIVG